MVNARDTADTTHIAMKHSETFDADLPLETEEKEA